MKRTSLYILAWLLYGIGHVGSKCMNTRFTSRLYPLYNWFMVKSLDVQEAGEKQKPFSGPWKTVRKRKKK